MRILALDSSAKAASVAMVEDGNLLGEFFLNIGLTHSQTLMPMVENLLTLTNTTLAQIDAFAVSTGPGSFTGLRIGIAAVKGMAFATDIPCFAVSTLHSMAYNFTDLDDENTVICAVMDARCNQVYNAIFEVCDKKITRLTPDRTISIEDLYSELENLGKKIIFVGDGASLCYNKNNCSLNVQLAHESRRFQRASSVAFAAYDDFLTGKNALSSAELLPQYLRIPQAERELNLKRN